MAIDIIYSIRTYQNTKGRPKYIFEKKELKIRPSHCNSDLLFHLRYHSAVPACSTKENII